MSVDEISSLIFGLDSCGNPQITLASLLGNGHNSYYQFRIEANEFVVLYKEENEVKSSFL